VASIFPSGSLESQGFSVTIPSWARPTIWMPIDIGCLARVLPTGGPLWMNELVIVLEIIENGQLEKTCLVMGRLGQTIFPFHVLDVQSREN